MPQSTLYRCPCCGSALTFGSVSQQLDCASCGNSFPLETMQAVSQLPTGGGDGQLHWADAAEDGFSPQESSALKAYHCQSCGAQILTDSTTAATECVYCGNPSILPDVLTGAYRPDGVIPFQKTKEEAKAAFRRHCRHKPLLPRGFDDENHLDKITGVYVPFWLFRAGARADCTYKTTSVSTHRSGQYMVTNTRHFLVHRGGSLRFSEVPVDGSSKMEDTLMESIEPFSYEAVKGFDIAFLSGYQAQRFDVDAKACQPRADERIRQSVTEVMRGTVSGYASVVPQSIRIDLTDSSVSQVLMPVWLLNTRWRDRMYTFAMNGQTGQFIGDLPTDKGRFWSWLLGLAGGIAAGGYGLLLLLYSLGVM